MKTELHENYSSSHEIQAGSDRAFGFVFAGFFSLVALWPLLSSGSVRLWALATAAAFAGLALTIPRILHPLNLLWTRVGILLNKITTPLFTGGIYFLIFTPVGSIRRMLGADPLHLDSTSEESYWIRRDPPGPPPESAVRQY